MKFFSRVKVWFISIRRLTAAIFLSMIAVLTIVAIYSYSADLYKSQKNQKYEKIQDWNYDLSNFGIKVLAKTKVVDGMLYFAVVIDGYPDYLTVPVNKERNYVFQFVDSDDFVIFEKTVSLPQFTTTVDEKSKPIGLNYQTTQFMDTSTYEKLKALKIKWTFDTNAKKLVSAPVVSNPKGDQSDHCAVGLSRDERLRRLALHGKLRETGVGDYSVGNKSLLFSYDGRVIFCN